MRLLIIFLLFSFLSVSKTINAQNATVADTVVADTSIFAKVEIEAGFPGGDEAWKNFLEKNLNGMIPVDKGAPVGLYRVLVQFIVDKTGAVSDVKALTSFGYGMEAEVVRIIKKSGLWWPAEQKGRKVKAYRTQPVVFMIDTDAFTITTAKPYTLIAGEENEVNVTADKTKPENIRLTVSQGTATPAGGGNFIIKGIKKGKLIIQVFIRNKNQGSAYFEVKNKDDR
jgi:Gram-negative bacterial TonB protein C-terminal